MLLAQAGLTTPATAQRLALEGVELISTTPLMLAPQLTVDLGPRAAAALEAGVALDFLLELELQAPQRLRVTRHLGLRYSPLLQRYELDIEGQGVRGYDFPSALLAGLERALLVFPEVSDCTAACSGRVRLQLDRSRLPAPLRLPSLFEADWQLDSGWRPFPP